MTVRVNTGVEGHSYDQEGATFSVDASGNLTISVPGGRSPSTRSENGAM